MNQIYRTKFDKMFYQPQTIIRSPTHTYLSSVQSLNICPLTYCNLLSSSVASVVIESTVVGGSCLSLVTKSWHVP